MSHSAADDRLPTAPLIAVTGRALAAGRVTRWSEAAIASPRAYADAVARAGGLPVVVPPAAGPDAAAAVVDRVDGVVLTGGPDVDPALYGQDPAPETYGVDRVTDDFEMAVAAAALDRGRPVLAICRGLQLVNVALGGSLHQHITGRPGLGAHGVPGAGGGGVVHDVVVAAGSQLAAVMGHERVACCSHHHQAVDRVGTGLVPVAWGDDGLLEACELPGSWLLAVQWHPEETANGDPAQQALFDALVTAAVQAWSTGAGAGGRRAPTGGRRRGGEAPAAETG